MQIHYKITSPPILHDLDYYEFGGEPHVYCQINDANLKNVTLPDHLNHPVKIGVIKDHVFYARDLGISISTITLNKPLMIYMYKWLSSIGISANMHFKETLRLQGEEAPPIGTEIFVTLHIINSQK